jgi:S1-C subfamily serine protease
MPFHWPNALSKRRGSSGGPIVNKRGEVVGLVFGIPSTDSDAIDKLGFGIALPSDEISRFLSEVDSGSDEVQDANFSLGPNELRITFGA